MSVPSSRQGRNAFRPWQGLPSLLRCGAFGVAAARPAASRLECEAVPNQPGTSDDREVRTSAWPDVRIRAGADSAPIQVRLSAAVRAPTLSGGVGAKAGCSVGLPWPSPCRSCWRPRHAEAPKAPSRPRPSPRRRAIRQPSGSRPQPPTTVAQTLRRRRRQRRLTMTAQVRRQVRMPMTLPAQPTRPRRRRQRRAPWSWPRAALCRSERSA